MKTTDADEQTPAPAPANQRNGGAGGICAVYRREPKKRIAPTRLRAPSPNRLVQGGATP